MRNLLNPLSLYNGDFKKVPLFTAATTTADRWINGQAAGTQALWAYGWAIPSGALAVGGGAYFDTSDPNNPCIKLENTTTGGAVSVFSVRTLTTPDPKYMLNVPFSTSITIEYTVEAFNAVANAVFLEVREYNSSLALVTTTAHTKVAAGDIAKVTRKLVVTTNAATRFLIVGLRNNIAGNISWAKFSNIRVYLTVQPTRLLI